MPCGPIPDGSYRCEMCGGVFKKARSDEEAEQERSSVFGQPRQADDAVVCADCYKAMRKAVPVV